MPQPISHASAMVIGGRILVVGGRSNGMAQDAIWQVDVDTGTAHLVARLPQPVSDFAVAVIGDTAYLIGGETDTQVASIVTIVIQ
jgi:N-acetylneuraminic acid mutarotase